MGAIYTRGGRLWLTYTDAAGARIRTSSTYTTGQEALAEEALAIIERRVAAERRAGAEAGPVTLKRYAAKWIAERRAAGTGSAADDDTRLKRYVLPTLGALRLTDLKPHHIRDLVRDLRRNGKTERGGNLAPRTVRHVYGVLHTLLHDAVVDELILANPCALKRNDLPKLIDATPGWRATAVYSRPEVEALVSDERIPTDRRVLYALKGLAGLRHGEAAALTWGAIDGEAKPLHRISVMQAWDSKEHKVKSVKTEVPRQVPCHPTLAKVLAEWKLSGWEATYGRAPTAADYIVPARTMQPRNHADAAHALRADLLALELRNRRGHDLRRAMISLCRADGARKDALHAVTHGASGDIDDLYTSWPWPVLCEAVTCLKVGLRRGTCHSAGTASARWRSDSGKVATPAGFEPALPT